MTTDWYVPCGVPAGFHRYEGLCIRRPDHEGPHSGLLADEPEAAER